MKFGMIRSLSWEERKIQLEERTIKRQPNLTFPTHPGHFKHTNKVVHLLSTPSEIIWTSVLPILVNASLRSSSSSAVIGGAAMLKRESIEEPETGTREKNKTSLNLKVKACQHRVACKRGPCGRERKRKLKDGILIFYCEANCSVLTSASVKLPACASLPAWQTKASLFITAGRVIRSEHSEVPQVTFNHPLNSQVASTYKFFAKRGNSTVMLWFTKTLFRNQNLFIHIKLRLHL